MVDFRFYLNKQGLRGAKGEKGDTGFSPSIVEGTNTINEYTLKVINEFDEFETPNLRGDHIDVSDPDGTYVRYNQQTGKSYVGSVDIASGETYGMIRTSTEEDFTDFSNNSAVTPASFADNLHNYLVSPDNSVRITQNPETSLTELKVNSGAVDDLVERVEDLEDDVLFLENGLNDLSRGLASTDSTVSALNTRVNGIRQDLTTEAQVRLNADNQQQQAIDAERQQRETQDAALQTQLNSKITVDNIKQGENITITKDGNNVTINSTAQGGAIIDDTEPATDKVYSSSKTSDLVGELGNEVNSIAGRLNTLEDEVVVATNDKLGLVKPDGTTVTIDENGTLHSVASGDVTSAGNNTFTGSNTFVGVDKLRVSKDGSEYVPVANHSNDILHKYNSDTQITEGLVIGNTWTNVTLAGNVGIKKYNSDTHRYEIADIISSDKIDNTTIEVNDQGQLQTTVDINALQEKVEELQLYKFPNATIEGDPTINNGQISNFSTTNYLRFPFEFKTEGRTWLLNGSFDTDSDITTQQNIIDSLASVALAVRNGRLVLALSTNGTSFDLGEHQSMSDILANTKYYYRLSFSGTQYLLSISTDKQEWLPEIIVTSNQPIASKPMTISSPGHPFKGTINLNDYDLTVGNILVWQGMDDVGISSRMDVNASNITETGKQAIKDIAGVVDVEEALTLLNGGDITPLDSKEDKPITYINGSSGYRIYSDGYCEQWGKIPAHSSQGDGEFTTITLLKSYKNTEYNIQSTPICFERAVLTTIFEDTNHQKTNNTFYIHIEAKSERASTLGLYWRTCGMLAEGEY